MKKIIILFIVFCNFSILAYVNSKTNNGQNIKWNVRNNSLNIYINPARNGVNSPSLSNSEIQQIINASISQWNNNVNFTINPVFVSETPSLGTTQTISFSQNSGYFGSGTIGITSLGYDPLTGDILAADILLNESFLNNVMLTNSASDSSGNNAYLGDVITHELGHFLGLGHSESTGSSMNYSISKNMYSLESDDINGAKSIYGKVSGREIYGRIVGKNEVGVFGANVSVLSHSTGKIISNVLSDENGYFSFQGLPKDEYVIYTFPIRSIGNLPGYYYSSVSNYCSGNNWVPSFFTKCGGRNKGRPQVVSTRDDISLDVGNITIRCDSFHDPGYLQLKNEGFVDNYQLRQTGDTHSKGQTFYGLFYKADIEAGTAGIYDKFEIDLRDIASSSGDLYLDLKVIAGSLGSAVDLQVDVKRSDLASVTYTVDTDIFSGKRELDLVVRHPLSTTSANNLFEVTVTPFGLTNTQKTEYFGAISDMINDQYYYSILQGVSQLNSSKYTMAYIKDFSYVEDNSSCLEGDVVQSSKAYISSIASSGSSFSAVESQPFSCGTIDIDSSDNDPPWGGMLSFTLGLCILLLPRIQRHIHAIVLS